MRQHAFLDARGLHWLTPCPTRRDAAATDRTGEADAGDRAVSQGKIQPNRVLDDRRREPMAAIREHGRPETLPDKPPTQERFRNKARRRGPTGIIQFRHSNRNTGTGSVKPFNRRSPSGEKHA